MSKGPSAVQIATAACDKALATLSEHDSRIEEAEAKLASAEMLNKTAVASTMSIEDAVKTKAQTAAEVAVFRDVLDDLLTERERLVADLTAAYEAIIGAATYDQAGEKFRKGLAEAAKHLKAAEKGLVAMQEASKVLSVQQMGDPLDGVGIDLMRETFRHIKHGYGMPNNRSLRSLADVVDWHSDRVGSEYSKKVTSHMAKQGRWALEPRDSEAYRKGRKTYLQKRALKKAS